MSDTGPGPQFPTLRSDEYEQGRIFSENGCRLRRMKVTNKGSADAYLMLFDRGSLPADGTVPEHAPLPIPAGERREWAIDIITQNGLTAVLSSTLTALTLVTANDGFFEAVTDGWPATGIAITLSAAELISYWSFDESSAIDRSDSQSGYDLVYQAGSPVGSAAGVLNNGVLVNSATFGGFLESAVAPGLKFDAALGMTFCGWVKANPAVGTRVIAFSWGNSWLFAISRQTVSWTFGGFDMFGHSDNIAIPVNAAFNGVPWFFRCWVDPADFKLRCKLNEGTTVVGTVALNDWTAVDDPVVDINGNGSHTTTDLFDECAIWKGVLTDADGLTMYGGGSPPSFPDIPYA